MNYDEPNQRTEFSLEWLHAPDLWVLALIVVPLVIAAVWWFYAGERGRLTMPRRVLLTVLRTALFLGLVAFLCEPMLTRERVQTRFGQILVLVDDSFSMGISDRYSDPALEVGLETAVGATIGTETRRIDLVSAFLSSPEADFVRRLREKGNVRIVACSDGTRSLRDLARLEDGDDDRFDAIDKIELRGKVTRLGDSLYEAVNELRGENINAVILFTDGRDNAGVLRIEEAARRLKNRGIPVYVVGVGNAEEPKDIRLFGFDIPEVVLEGDIVSVDFSLLSDGFEGERVSMKLTLLDAGGIPVGKSTEQYIVLGADGEVQSERLEFRPRNSGKFVARLEVEAQEGELFEDNNFLEKPITVLSQKIKVLYVDGPPRYEYRYLKNALILDPTMETQCLLVSADASFPQEASTGLPPLRRFPQTREELFEYHLVILGDVSPEHQLMPEGWQDWLVEFVDDIGGGVVFVSGPGYMPQKYRGSPIEKLFPVELEDAPRSILSRGALTTMFHPRRTAEGQEHPVMQFTGDPEKDATLWGEVIGRTHRQLPGFYWYSRVKQVRRGGVALAVHEDPTEDHFKYGPRPLFAYQYLGRGRTFMSLVDSTWRWRRNVGNYYFYRFWGQIIRFTSAGRLLGKTQRFSVASDQREYTLGGQVRILARKLNPEFKPTGDTECTVFMERLNDPDSTPQELTALQVPARPAYYEVAIEARELGDNRLWIEDRGEEAATTTFRVVVPQLEYEEPRMNEAGLQQIANMTSGKYHGLVDAAEIPNEVKALEVTIPISAEQKSLWDAALFLLLFAGVITLEWVLRKGFRLL